MTNRKLLTEIDKTLKKVIEGVEIFEGIFEKITQATNQSQKEKFEGDLKKEIKKLQRYRDQIKTWASSNDIKDKKSLQESRKLIETQMERFKAMEKELKTKAYSQAGLNAAQKLDPEEIQKDEIRRWISEQTEALDAQIDSLEAERELTNQLKKPKKVDTVKAERLEKISYWTERHRFHQKKLEAVLRMIDNGNLKPDQVEPIQDDIKYYIDENQDDEFEENEYIYEDLNLEDADVLFGANEDESDDEEVKSPKDSDSKKGSSESIEKTNATPPRKKSVTVVLTPTTKEILKPPKVVPVLQKPAPTTPRAYAPSPVDLPPAPPPILRYAAAASTTIPKDSHLTSDINQLIGNPLGELGSSAAIAAVQKMKPPMPEKRSSVSSISSTVPTAQLAAMSVSYPPPLTREDPAYIHTLPEPSAEHTKMPPALADLVASFDATKERAKRADRTFVNSMVDLSFLNLPEAADSEKMKNYFPQNPYPVPGFYPQTPLSVFTTTPAIFEKFDTDTLFFIFYFRPGTQQQYLAARELKRQSWRFHKKYLTWFQRHEEPSEVNENYEQGTYVYFDYEKSWCQRKKSDFRFEYKFLLDDE